MNPAAIPFSDQHKVLERACGDLINNKFLQLGKSLGEEACFSIIKRQPVHGSQLPHGDPRGITVNTEGRVFLFVQVQFERHRWKKDVSMEGTAKLEDEISISH